MSCTASKVIAVAAAEIGYKEKASNSQLDDKTANAGSANYTKYANYFDKECPDWYNGKKNGYAWCDMFVDWCFHMAFGHEKALELLCQPEKSCGAGCTYSAGYYKAKGRFYTSNPKPGDQIFFGTSISNCSHTGIVEKVDSSKVYTIEGNTSDVVARRSYALSYAKIVGYGRPAYDAETSEPAAGTPDQVTVAPSASLKVGDTVAFTGSKQYTNSYSNGKQVSAKPCTAKVTAISTGKPHPYHLIGDGVYGWVDVSDIQGTSTAEIKVGSIVKMNGTTHYTSSYSGAKGVACKGGEAKVTAINKNGAHPYHLIHTGKNCTVYGWVNAEDVSL